MPDVRVSQLYKTFGDVTVLHEVDFTIRDGEFFTLLGPSGCGKSTTLNCIAGLEKPTGGTITVGDTTFVDSTAKIFRTPEERNLGMVFQSYALWPHMTVAANLAMPLTIRKASKKDKQQRIADALDKVGLAHLADRYPHQLSGGQQQRVALARALVYSPSVLLLDEPLSNLDAKLREQARAWLKALQAELGITTVYVTHDQDEALALSDRIAVMADGRMLQIGTPKEIYETPAAPEVAAFVGRCNFLHGQVEKTDDDHVHVRLDACGEVVEVTGDAQPGQQVTVAVRPERLTVGPTGTGLPCEIVTSAYVGSHHEYHLRLGDQTVQVQSPRGDLTGAVGLTFAPEAALLYPRPLS
ncbi:ABC transporter ATP-binding protein [Actinoplanes italicus]|uniref:ABC-type quaternary amine transporter n=1 Tax=Actinoplanes italicus TaxID=113567 RepID=A0A2T0JZK7_9ACTN|nr:ABC transporter ATP-binding protein [Actinoplanes italicus]PRX15935.1 iron(III) transport system ATP-binding protein [Actinoplanes italicus]GIE28735.1 ABC transporter ATP-binding protein [Actinoplanes italicus]